MPVPLYELLIIRHAKSDWSDNTLPDHDRPLAEKGKKQACKIGNWLAENHLIPQRILVSPATRAQQTLNRLMRHWDEKPDIVTLPALYEGGLDDVRRLIRQQPDTLTRLAIIGHNPLLETLLEWLTASDEPLHLSTCATTHLILPDSWQTLQPNQARLIQHIRPNDL